MAAAFHCKRAHGGGRTRAGAAAPGVALSGHGLAYALDLEHERGYPSVHCCGKHWFNNGLDIRISKGLHQWVSHGPPPLPPVEPPPRGPTGQRVPPVGWSLPNWTPKRRVSAPRDRESPAPLPSIYIGGPGHSSTRQESACPAVSSSGVATSGSTGVVPSPEAGFWELASSVVTMPGRLLSVPRRSTPVNDSIRAGS